MDSDSDKVIWMRTSNYGKIKKARPSFPLRDECRADEEMEEIAMISADYLKARTKSEFTLMVALEDRAFEGERSIDDLDNENKTAILEESKSNIRKKLVRQLAGLGMEGLWPLKKHGTEDGDSEDFHEFPPYVLLFFRRILRSEMKNTLTGKISKAQTAKKSGNMEKHKEKLMSITNQDIECFAAELRRDHEEWKRLYLSHHGISETEYEEWRKTTNERTENSKHDDWHDLAEWYHHTYKQEKKTAETATTQKEPTKLPGWQNPAAKLDQESRARRDKILDKIESGEALLRKRGEQKEDDSIPDETLARMLELHAEWGNMERMLAEVKLLIKQKRELETLKETIHRNLDEVIERAYGLETITERQFEVLVPHEIRSPKGGEHAGKTAKREMEEDLAVEQESQHVMLPLFLHEKDQAEEERQATLMLTNTHKLRYVKNLSKILEGVCEAQKKLMDMAAKEMERFEKKVIFGNEED